MARRFQPSRTKQNPDTSLFLDAVRHAWVWGGVGMIIRGGDFFGIPYVPLGIASLAYGLYDLTQTRKKRSPSISVSPPTADDDEEL